MKEKIFIALLFLITLNAMHSKVEAKCFCWTKMCVYNNGIDSLYDAFEWIAPPPSYIFISPGDSIRFWAHSDNSSCQGHNYIFYYNGNIVSQGSSAYNLGFTQSVFDTGHYYLYHWCNAMHYYIDVYVNFFPSTSISAQSMQSIQIIPSVSTGIFNIKSGVRKLKQLLVSDNTGRTVLSSVYDFSEINLTSFPPGIYFYSITDEKENVFRGKIIKK